jgi:hypothetical protein
MPTEPAVKRTIAFVDGQNLFHAAKEAFGYEHPKGIDVRLALDILGLGHRNSYDVALVFGQDQDLSEVADDNQLLDTPFLAGPDATRMNRARDEQELFFKQHPTASERDYLLHVFDAVGRLPGMREFFDRRHNPLWLAGPTGDALAGLLDFWRKTDPDTGTLVHDFSDPCVSGKSEIRNKSEIRSPKRRRRAR